MYCPRCGSPNTETTKFCRQCGLPMAQLTGYVASGGTAPLAAPPATRNPLDKMTEGMTPRQKMLLAILFFIFIVPVFGALGLGPLAKIAAVLMAPGIIWSVFHFKAQERRMQQQWMMHPQMPPLAQPHSIQPPIQQPVLPTQNYQPPVYQPPAPPPTNPLRQERGSVIEDETRRLPGQNG